MIWSPACNNLPNWMLVILFNSYDPFSRLHNGIWEYLAHMIKRCNYSPALPDSRTAFNAFRFQSKISAFSIVSSYKSKTGPSSSKNLTPRSLTFGILYALSTIINFCFTWLTRIYNFLLITTAASRSSLWFSIEIFSDPVLPSIFLSVFLAIVSN